MAEENTTAELTRDVVKTLLYGSAIGNRYTQDSPVLLEVWSAFAENPGDPQDLLLTPWMEEPSYLVADLVDRILHGSERGEQKQYEGFRAARPGRTDSDISDVPGIVAVRLYLDELVSVLLPLTKWWNEAIIGAQLEPCAEVYEEVIKAAPRLNPFRMVGDGPEASMGGGQEGSFRILLLIALTGLADDVLHPLLSLDPDDDVPKDLADAMRGNLERRFDARFVEGAHRRKLWDDLQSDARPLIFLVTLNRPSRFSTHHSVPTIKADAARLLFETSCEDITWAVVDSGIEMKHPAFLEPLKIDQDATEEEEAIKRARWEDERPSRIKRAYDMMRLRFLRSRDLMRRVRRRKSNRIDMARRLVPQIANDAQSRINAMIGDGVVVERKDGKGPSADVQRVAELLRRIAVTVRDRRPLDWDLIEPLIRVKDSENPSSPHGTHVAGILGAGRKIGGWKGPRGVCPDIRIWDFRVVGRAGAKLSDVMEETEFAILAALQFIRHLNDRNDWVSIHGANLSLSLDHDVDNYACGRTPVCLEAERLVNDGVAVVAAAGNRGYMETRSKRGFEPTFVNSSITDPGNAELVITVGSTHRLEPHSYGVSYFSSRGPTADGRLKPDLVAPGEKITSAGLNGGELTLGGTSMAAPHVSGAAAMLMARFPELIGQPRRIKEILRSSATDLNRERYFQGAGLVDVLRAMQSI